MNVSISRKTSDMISNMQTAWTMMECHYLLSQIADILLQLYETGNPGIKKAKRTKKNIFGSEEKFWQATHRGKYIFLETRSYIITTV